jgi:hypothetical protein
LINASVRGHVGANQAQPVADVAARWFEHGKVLEVCEELVRWADAHRRPRPAADAPPADQQKWESWRRSAPKVLRVFGTVYPAGPSRELREVADGFTTLCEERQRADYDPTVRYSRATASEFVDTATIALAALEAAASDPLRPLFLLLLMTTTGIVRDR